MVASMKAPSTVATTDSSPSTGRGLVAGPHSRYSWVVLRDCLADGECEVPAVVVRLVAEGVGERSNLELMVVLALTSHCLEGVVEICDDLAEVLVLDDWFSCGVVGLAAATDGAPANEFSVLVELVGDLAGGGVFGGILEADDAVRGRRAWFVDRLELAKARKAEAMVILEEIQKPSSAVLDGTGFAAVAIDAFPDWI